MTENLQDCLVLLFKILLEFSVQSREKKNNSKHKTKPSLKQNLHTASSEGDQGGWEEISAH